MLLNRSMMKADIRKRQKESTIIINVLIWMIILCFPYLAYASGVRVESFKDYLMLLRLPVSVACVYYVNYYFLVEKFLTREKAWLFICSNICLILLAIAFERVTSFPMMPMPPIPDDAMPPVKVFGKAAFMPMHYLFVNTLLYLCASGTAVVFRMIQWWYLEEEMKREQEHSHVRIELQNLKKQINPHFLFNTLNNIYSFIGTDTVQARHSMDSLCALLRYALYRSENPEVMFSEEVAFVKDYVELARLRLPKYAELSVDLPDSPSDTAVAPMLFITLVENAFKHGVKPEGNSFIHISMKENDGRLICAVENSMYKKRQDKEPETGGIGLENMNKRLKLIYGNHYIFRYGIREDGVYRSYLEIDTRRNHDSSGTVK